MLSYIGFPSFWIGVTDMYSEGVWQKATSLGRQRYFNWKHAEPNSDGGQENCVEVYTHHHMKWNDRRCSSSWSFVCEKWDDWNDSIMKFCYSKQKKHDTLKMFTFKDLSSDPKQRLN